MRIVLCLLLLAPAALLAQRANTLRVPEVGLEMKVPGGWAITVAPTQACLASIGSKDGQSFELLRPAVPDLQESVRMSAKGLGKPAMATERALTENRKLAYEAFRTSSGWVLVGSVSAGDEAAPVVFLGKDPVGSGVLNTLLGGLAALGQGKPEVVAEAASKPAALTGKRQGFSRPNGPPVDFVLPKGWSLIAPRSSMRIGELKLPGANGPSCVAFYFGAGGGGPMRANLDRWIGQMKPSEPAKEKTLKIAPGIEAVLLSVRGTLKASTMGASSNNEQSGQRMLAAVMTCPKGPLYFKLTGPEAVISGQEKAFESFLASFRKR